MSNYKLNIHLVCVCMCEEDTCVVFKPDCSYEAGRSPFEMLGISTSTTLDSAEHEVCIKLSNKN